MKFLDIAAKDLRQTITNWRTPVFMLLMPVVFTIFLGVAFSEQGNEDPRTPVAIIDSDGGALADAIMNFAESSVVIRVVEPAEQDAAAIARQIEAEDLGAAVFIPAGYSESTFTGQPQASEIVYDDGSQAGQAARSELAAILLRVAGAVEAGQLAAEAREASLPFTSEMERAQFVADATQAALADWENPPYTVDTELTGTLSEDSSYNSFAQSSPGMMIQFSIIGLMGAAGLLVNERKSRALQRILTTPTSRTAIIGGKLLSAFVLVFAQILVLSLFGQFAYGLPYYQHPFAMLLLSTSLALAISALGLLIGVLAPGSESVVVMFLVPMFLLSALGGAWFPLEITPPLMQTIGLIATPTAWAMTGYQNIILRDLGLESVLLSSGIILIWAGVLFGLVVWRLRRIL